MKYAFYAMIGLALGYGIAYAYLAPPSDPAAHRAHSP